MLPIINPCALHSINANREKYPNKIPFPTKSTIKVESRLLICSSAPGDKTGFESGIYIIPFAVHLRFCLMSDNYSNIKWI